MKKVILLILASLAVSDCYNFLFIYPYPSKSLIILSDALVKALLERGHQVTYANPFPTLKPTKGLTVLDYSFMLEGWEEKFKDELPQLHEQKESQMTDFKGFAYNVTYEYVKHELLQTVLKDKNQHFDAVVSDWFLSNFLTALPAAIGSPSIMTTSYGMVSQTEYTVDEVVSPGVQPFLFTEFISPMSFFERVRNTYIVFSMIAAMKFIDNPAEELVYKDILGPVAAARGVELPDFTTATHNISLVLSNSHHTMLSVSKLPPNVIEIGGFHVDDKSQPLTPELKEIMDNAKHGVIFFSLGTNVKSKDLPLTVRTQLLDLFKELKQTVIWKFEDDLFNLPTNVHVVKWAPQQGILAHPNIKIFMTHGGLLSTTEAIHFGVPLIGIPFLMDQHMNVARAVQKGYALKVLFTDSNFIKILSSHINEILHNPKYTIKVKDLSTLYHDRPIHPRDLAVYWIEHVARTRGAIHLRSPALQVSWYQRCLLDILALLIGILLLIKWILRWSFNKLTQKKRKVE